jgi:hypothetical protein
MNDLPFVAGGGIEISTPGGVLPIAYRMLSGILVSEIVEL